MDGRNYLHEDIVKKIDEQNRHSPIVLKLLKPGTMLTVQTQNSTYIMDIIEGTSLFIQGGSHWPKPTLVKFHGSTWGSNMIWLGRIGYNMHMEIITERGAVLTSPVQAARIESPDDWYYNMDWVSS